MAIIDLERGKQPFVADDGDLVLAVNGEIYNFKELRSELEAKGHHFQTNSDSECILHLYEEYNEDFANYLELYREYEQSYRVKEILDGTISDVMIQRVKRASFDEKLSVISLLLGGLFDSFKESYRTDLYVTELFEALKECKAVLLSERNVEKRADELLEKQLRMREKSLGENMELGLYDKEQVRAHRAVLKTLDGYLLEVKKQNLMNPEDTADIIYNNFKREFNYAR